MTKKDIPTNINKYPHKFFERVRWGDTDGYQHVNNVSISRYFESARVNIIRELESKEFSLVIVNFTINYYSQIFYPNKILIGSFLSKIGDSSITIVQALFVKNKCKSTAKSIMAYADLKNEKSQKIDYFGKNNMKIVNFLTKYSHFLNKMKSK